MSTKIYDGYRMPIMSLPDLADVIFEDGKIILSKNRLKEVTKTSKTKI